jgi:hypothetical protein
VKSVVLFTGSHILMEIRVNTEASNGSRRYRAGIFEWTGLEFLRPAARPAMSDLVMLDLTGIEQPWPLMLPLAHELPHEQASLREIGEFIARCDPTRHFREHWGERYREQVGKLWNDCVIAYRGHREATVAPGELLLCLAYDWRLGPCLGVPEQDKLAFLRWLIEQTRMRL